MRIQWVCGTVLAALLASGEAEAQTPTRVRVGAMLPYGLQPGARATLSLGVGASSGADAAEWTHGVRFGMALGVFERSDHYSALLLGALVGYQFESPTGCCMHVLNAEVAFLGASHITAVGVNLASGATENVRTWQSGALLSLHYVFTWQFARRWGWYVDIGAGQTVLGQTPSAVFFAPETGLQFRFDVQGTVN